MDTSPPKKQETRPGARRLLADANPDATRTRILDAAFRQLTTAGYAALSMRQIAKDAGVNHALINYHFRSKDQLVIEVLDEANRQLLQRQQRMYGESGSFADKWRQAREFYEQDLASGFVRVQAELWAASMADEELRATFLPRLLAWRNLVRGGVRDALATLETRGTRLPSPFTADVIACWISEFWLGMEFMDLIATPRERAEHEAALDAVEALLKQLDALGRKQPTRRRRT